MDIFDYFDKNIYNNDINYKRDKVKELDDLWNEYCELLEEVKSEGFKVYRNDNGIHKVVKK